jgi:hypothetical protein
MQPNTTCITGKEKRIENLKHAPESPLQLKNGTSVLQKLLAASKDAEVLIACMFEQHVFTAAPLQEIWERLAAAIDEAQSSLQAEHSDVFSAQSSRGYRERRL